ncbi:MAG: excalibur calcium-binding domain-containing protein [Pseudonocardiales bacterium]
MDVVDGDTVKLDDSRTLSYVVLPDGRAFSVLAAEAHGAGAAPLYAGEPGYRAGLDRDGDGVACES